MSQSSKTPKPAQLRFAIGECSLGSILVARSEVGIRAILLGDDPHRLVAELAVRFPQTTLIQNDEELVQRLPQVIGLVEQPGRELDLLLDIRGTVFQQRVWEALRGIPAGSTASYAEIARRIGAPNSARAVPRPAPPINLRSLSRAIGWCALTGEYPDIGGVWNANGHCSNGRRAREYRNRIRARPD